MARGKKRVKLNEQESPDSPGIYETPNSEEREEEYEGNASGSEER